MPILNYTTTVAPERSVGEIVSLLARKGARSVTQEYSDAGKIAGVSFILSVGGMPTRFSLPANVEGVAGVMLREKPWSRRSSGGEAVYKQKVKAKAEWVAWRILKDWVEAQMALIESGQAQVAQVFLPYATEQSGRTVFELFVENNQKQIGSGA